MKKTLLTLLTVLTLSVSGQEKSVVLIDVQQQINTIQANQQAAGGLLLEARRIRVNGLIVLTTTSIVGGTLLAVSKGHIIGNGFGIVILTVGGSVSIYKLVESFNYIGKAGRVLTGKN